MFLSISPKCPKMFQKLIFLQIYLHICEKSYIVAAEILNDSPTEHFLSDF